MRLENKVALISGGARGIGAAVTRAFAREGAKIVIGDVLEDEGRRTAEEVTAAGGECYFVKLDVISEADWVRARAEEHTSELQSLVKLGCRLRLEKKKNIKTKKI